MLFTEGKQKARLIEHFQEVLNQTEPTTELDLSNYILREQLEINMTNITYAEITRAINSLTKAPGTDEISIELLKHGKHVISS